MKIGVIFIFISCLSFTIGKHSFVIPAFVHSFRSFCVCLCGVCMWCVCEVCVWCVCVCVVCVCVCVVCGLCVCVFVVCVRVVCVCVCVCVCSPANFVGTMTKLWAHWPCNWVLIGGMFTEVSVFSTSSRPTLGPFRLLSNK